MLLLSKYLKVYTLLACILLFKNVVYCQNLIQNGSFENYTSPVNCSGGGGGFDNYSVFPVNHVVDNWETFSSPDYFSVLCSGSNNNGSPMNIFGYNQAKDGNSYAGFLTYLKGGETKEYIYQQLSVPLDAGKTYCLSFYIAKADRIPYAVANIGACFSNTVLNMGANGYLTATPQIISQSGFLTDTTQWVHIQGCFTASGGEQYITIGKFNTTGTDTLNVGTSNPIPGNTDESYYYIDDISLIDQTTVGINDFNNEDYFEIYPNPTVGTLNLKYKFNTEHYTIKIVDIIGKEVLNEKCKEELNVSNLEKGIYFLSLYMKDQLTGTKKININ